MDFTILRKTLFERKLSTIIWLLSTFFFVFLIMLMFPSLRDSLGTSLQDVPESVQKFLGNAQDYQQIGGYVDIQVVNQMVFLTIIMGIIFGIALIAGEEKSGLLHTQLARPITRAKIYWQKAGALAISTIIVAWLGVFLGVFIGVLAINEEVDILRLFQASGMIWLITFFFAALAFALGAITGKRAIAGIIAGSYAFVAYMLDALSQLAESLEKLNYVSVFRYFNTPSVMKTGLDVWNIAILSALIIALFVIGFIIFRRRDLTNR